jgi:hypothetical protein
VDHQLQKLSDFGLEDVLSHEWSRFGQFGWFGRH